MFSASVSNFKTINFSEVKVKVQGQTHTTENLLLVIALPWFKISLPNLTILLK